MRKIYFSRDKQDGMKWQLLISALVEKWRTPLQYNFPAAVLGNHRINLLCAFYITGTGFPFHREDNIKAKTLDVLEMNLALFSEVSTLF